MSYQIVPRPDGNYAVWSSVIDDFVIDNVRREDVVTFFKNQAARQAENDVLVIFAKIDAHQPPYYQFTMTYEECMAERWRVHEKDLR